MKKLSLNEFTNLYNNGCIVRANSNINAYWKNKGFYLNGSKLTEKVLSVKELYNKYKYGEVTLDFKATTMNDINDILNKEVK